MTSNAGREANRAPTSLLAQGIDQLLDFGKELINTPAAALKRAVPSGNQLKPGINPFVRIFARLEFGFGHRGKSYRLIEITGSRTVGASDCDVPATVLLVYGLAHNYPFNLVANFITNVVRPRKFFWQRRETAS